MKPRILKIVHACDRLNQWVGSVVVTTAVFLFIGIIFSNVVMRYVFNTSFVFMAELEWHVFAFIFLLGAGFTLLHDGHVRVDIFYSMMNEKQQAWVNFFGVLLLLIPSCYLVLTTTVPWVIDAYKVGETSIDPGGIPARFLIKAALPAGYFLMLIQGLLLAVRSLLIIMGHPVEDLNDAG
ncbi:MAG: TRAP transporter small permease subunit [Desulfobacteraceae bacterium]|nr:MAG: TRAP transporter small permease subunit [Desulfobacteraceae bacterium]